jgi:hypothetical protein
MFRRYLEEGVLTPTTKLTAQISPSEDKGAESDAPWYSNFQAGEEYGPEDVE